jgi:hypothetical protein
MTDINNPCGKPLEEILESNGIFIDKTNVSSVALMKAATEYALQAWEAGYDRAYGNNHQKLIFPHYQKQIILIN